MSEIPVNTSTRRLWLGTYAGLLVACCSPQPAARARPRSEPQCVRTFPVPFVLRPSTLATESTPGELTLPTAIVESISRAGRSHLMYTVTVCGVPPVITGVERSTGFADLDRFLDASVLELSLNLPGPGCTSVTLVLEHAHRACEPPTMQI
jgi:hypothetical protein